MSGSAGARSEQWERSWTRRGVRRRRSRRCASAIGRGDVYQVNLVQHLSAPFDGDPAAARGAARGASAARARRRRLGDRLRLAGALPRPPRPARLDVPDQGHAAARRARRGREGRGRARDDRRPRAERPLARLRAGLGALARADGRARARRRRRTSSRRSRARCATTSASPSCSPRRSPAAPSRARRRSRRSTRSRALEPVGRGASMGALGTVRGNGDLELALTIRTFAVAEGRDPPLGRRRHRLGLRARGRDRGVVDEGAAAARRDRRAARGGRAVTLLAVAVGGRGVVDPDEPVLRADDEALLRGRAAFETMRVYGGSRSGSAEHLDRLAASAERLGLPAVNRLELEELARRRSTPRARRTRSSASSGRRRPPRSRSSASSPTTTRTCASGARLISLRGIRAEEPWLLPGVKSTSYAVNMAAEAEAKRRGADDAVFVDARRDRARGPDDEHLVAARAHALHALARPRHPRRRHARGRARARRRARATRSRRARTPSSELAGADEAFTSSSVREVMPVIELDGGADRPRPGRGRAAGRSADGAAGATLAA